jgi:DNA segregation ATPase FtsK/SpoIIIE, S-DNA-T family
MQELKEKEKQTFKIHQIKKGTNIRSKRDYEHTPFVSPIFGTKVKDVVTVPFDVHTNINSDKAYDPFRTEPKLTKEEYKEKYGEYADFKNIISDETRKDFFKRDFDTQNDLDELQDDTKDHIMKPINRIKNEDNKAPEENQTLEDETLNLEEKAPLDSKDNLNETYTIDLQPEEEIELAQEPFEGVRISSSFFDQTDHVEDVFHTQQPMKKEVHEKPKVSSTSYELPSVSIFSKSINDTKVKPQWLLDQVDIINQTLLDFSIEGMVFDSKKGPTVTRHEIALEPGVSVKKVNNIQDNLMMNLAATSVRIEAPIPGKPYVGIEVPNVEKETVAFGNIVDDDQFMLDLKPLKVALGMDIDGNHVYADIQSMPHGLIAGATNSGKSVCVNTILVSLLLKNKPDMLKLLLIDPKIVELTAFNDLPHLLTPVITDPKIAAQALDWIVQEMERRYKVFASARMRNIASYNVGVESQSVDGPKMPYIVIVIDELADLIMVASKEVEDAIQRITQKARAAGIHLLVATQRPTTDVIKGTIKSNIPVRIAFKVASFVDSTTIIDGAGAETLLGKGDMLFKTNDSPKRLQGAYITDDEIFAVTDFIRAQQQPNYLFGHEELVRRVEKQSSIDPIFEDVARFVVESKSCSINAIQKEFKCGFNRAQSIVDMLVATQIVEPSEGTKPKEVRISSYELEEILTEIL